MRKIIIAFLLLSILFVSGLSGCFQKTENIPPAAEGISDATNTSAASISSDLESISSEVASINVNDSDAITPLTETDLATD